MKNRLKSQKNLQISKNSCNFAHEKTNIIINNMGEAALKQAWTPTISRDEFENNYMTLEQSSARLDALIQQHFHPEVSCK